MKALLKNCRRPFQIAVITSATLLAAGSRSEADSFLFDFASSTNPTNLSGWNNITTAIGTTNGAGLFDIVTTDNVVTNIDLIIVSRFSGENANGTLASTLFPSSATRDSLYGNTETFSGNTNVFPSFKFTDLDPTKTYDFTFYASRTGVSDNRETQYTISGAASGSAVLNAANNIDNSVTFSGMVPDANREILISLAPGVNNNNANHFTYLGVLKIDAVPEPSTAAMLIGGVGVLLLRRRRGEEGM